MRKGNKIRQQGCRKVGWMKERERRMKKDEWDIEEKLSQGEHGGFVSKVCWNLRGC